MRALYIFIGLVLFTILISGCVDTEDDSPAPMGGYDPDDEIIDVAVPGDENWDYDADDGGFNQFTAEEQYALLLADHSPCPDGTNESDDGHHAYTCYKDMWMCDDHKTQMIKLEEEIAENEKAAAAAKRMDLDARYREITTAIAAERAIATDAGDTEKLKELSERYSKAQQEYYQEIYGPMPEQTAEQKAMTEAMRKYYAEQARIKAEAEAALEAGNE